MVYLFELDEVLRTVFLEIVETGYVIPFDNILL